MAQLLEMETSLSTLLKARNDKHGTEPYTAVITSEIVDVLQKYFEIKMPNYTVSDVNRVGGGASKEQFFFLLTDQNGANEKYILRMDPKMAITETGRDREYHVLKAMKGVVPVPEPVWLDQDGSHFPQPAVIMRAVSGITKPSDSSLKVSGLGTNLGPRLRGLLKEQFLDHLVAIHAYDWRSKPITGFEVPVAGTDQASQWAYHYWCELWRIDKGQTRPIIALTQQWLGANLPKTEATDMVLIHGDYRTGNYLFDEDTGEITALLDWELSRIGDFHEDIAWVIMIIFGTRENGLFRASDLFEREEFITAYEQKSGRTINRKTLHYYEVMSSWKTYVIVAANGLAAARAEMNHQDVLLTFLANAAPMFADDLVRLLSTGEE